MTEKSERRKEREEKAQEIATALQNFNGNPDTEQALRAIIEYLNLDIEVGQ